MKTLLLCCLVLTGCGPSLETLHAGARAGVVQPDAPLQTRRSVLIDAPVDAVWSVLADIAGWHAWQP